MNASEGAAQLWGSAALAPSSLSLLSLPGSDPLPSSFRIASLAQSTIGVCALAASQLQALRTGLSAPPPVSVDAADAAGEFRSEQLATLHGIVGKVWDELVGVYETEDEDVAGVDG